jgi:hypothetical protein|tara:strand:+ start:1456 stop:1842 length:387 start_codon:yes stop_codon:yes gene_type:complete
MRARDFITPIKKEFQDPADDPNAGFDKEFKQDSMFNQLGKILDSRGNPRPLDTVITDDGKKHKVNFQQAKMIRMLLTAPQVKPDLKRQFTKDIQNSETLEKFLQTDDMGALFRSMYGGADAEPTNYGR